MTLFILISFILTIIIFYFVDRKLTKTDKNSELKAERNFKRKVEPKDNTRPSF